MDTDLHSLNLRYAIPGHVSFHNGPGNLLAASVQNSHAEATVTLAGAHVMAYARRGEPPVLWESPTAAHSISNAMRGGVPICWPWFAEHAADPINLPIHGLVRTMVWELTATHACPDGSTELRM